MEPKPMQAITKPRIRRLADNEDRRPVHCC